MPSEAVNTNERAEEVLVAEAPVAAAGLSAVLARAKREATELVQQAADGEADLNGGVAASQHIVPARANKDSGSS